MAHHDQSEFSEKRTFLGRFGFAIGVVVLAVIVVTVFSKMFSGRSDPAPRKPQELVMIKPAPLPPPPPPPPTPPQNEPQKQMMEQQPLDDQDVKPEEAPADALPNIGTNIQGNGPADGFGLSGKGGNFIGGGGGGKHGGSRFGWYANKVSRAVEDALRQNSRTRTASFVVKVRLWADVTGRVTKVRLADSTGDK